MKNAFELAFELKRKHIPVYALLAVLAPAFFYACYSWAKNDEAPVQTKPATEPATKVATLIVNKQLINAQRSFPGRVYPHKQSVVRPQVDGIITQRMFEGGAEIQKGQQLYQIDDARYRAVLKSKLADLESANADLQAAQARVMRYENLVNTQAISQQDYEDVMANFARARAAVAVAQAAVELAQVDLDYTKVYAPISGRISRSLVTEGALVTANQVQELATITQLDPVYVDMQVSGNAVDLAVLNKRVANKLPTPVRLQLDSRTDSELYSHAGELILSEVTVDESTGATALRALLPNPEHELLPGMFVHALVDMGTREAILIPQRASTRMPTGDLKVWIVDAESKAHQREIKVEAAYEDNWIVLDGLVQGDQIIVEGYQKVREGEVVSATVWESAQDMAVSL